MRDNRHSGHTVTRLTAHVVWVARYRYHVLEGEIKVRCRDLLVQICDAEDGRILKGVVSKDHIHMHIEYPPSKSLSDLMKRFKGRTSRRLQQEYPHLRKRYWGRHFWAIGYGAWSRGNITKEVVQEYLEHHRHPSNKERLTVYEMPGYSPDYNPIETLWKKIKQKYTHLHYFASFEALVNKVEEAMLGFANAPKEVMSLFGFYEELVAA